LHDEPTQVITLTMTISGNAISALNAAGHLAFRASSFALNSLLLLGLIRGCRVR
jgi:hypothetical protein